MLCLIIPEIDIIDIALVVLIIRNYDLTRKPHILGSRSIQTASVGLFVLCKLVSRKLQIREAVIPVLGLAASYVADRSAKLPCLIIRSLYIREGTAAAVDIDRAAVAGRCIMIEGEVPYDGITCIPDIICAVNV